MDDGWIEYKCKSGQTLFIYNKMTGEHKWSPGGSNESVTCKEFHCIATQTDDYGCNNGCTSMYANTDSYGCSNSSTVTLPQPQLDGPDEAILEVHNETPPENCLQYRVEQDDHSGIYEVSVADVLEELHVEYPCENNTKDSNNFVNSGNIANMIPCQLNETKDSSNMKKCFEIPFPESSTQSKDDSTDNINEDMEIYLHSNSTVHDSSTSCHTKRFHKCSYCPKQFDSTGKLADHIRIHTGEKPFHCIYCEKKFAKKCNQQRHLRRHTGERNFECSLCDKKFIDSSELQRHGLKHTGERPFACHYCEKTFTQKNNLTSHLQRHTGEGKFFDCSYCEKQFAHKTDFYRHIRIHTGEKPFECHYCEKKFSAKYGLDRHIRSHLGIKRFQCAICDQRFSEKKNLDNHLTLHERKKSFECSRCEKKFVRKSDLDNHLMAHTCTDKKLKSLTVMTTST